MKNDGFTLIEVLIASALGLAIVIATFSGFRVASQCVTAANRLSLENALLRGGYFTARENEDYWIDRDDPLDPNRQQLRAYSGLEGLPFTPLKMVMPTAISGSAQESDRGWDEAYSWRANDKRTWWRGNAAEFWRGDLRFGRYALFANTRDSLSGADTYDSYGDNVTVAHTWLYNQLHGLIGGLGSYGAGDYLPANTLYSFYEPYMPFAAPAGPKWTLGEYISAYDPGLDGATSRGGMPIILHKYSEKFANKGGGTQEQAQGMLRLTMTSAFVVGNPNRSPIPTVPELIAEHRGFFDAGYTAAMDPAKLAALNQVVAIPAEVAPVRPTNWPNVTVSTARFIKNRRFVALSTIHLSSPLSGEILELTFSGFSTSLRGARLQRRPDGGWAKWDNSAGSVNDPTLDSP